MTASPPPALTRLLRASDPGSRDQAWAAFVRTYSPLLLATARKFGGDHDAAMDLYTYVLERLGEDDFSRLRRYAADGRSQFTTWLVVVSRRLCIDYRRQRYGRPRSEANPRREVERVLRKRLVDFIGEDLEPMGAISGNGADPEHTLRARELRGALHGALQDLPSEDRLLLAYRYEDELNAREIARLMDFPSVFHVYRRINALQRTLRDVLEEQGVDDAAP